MTKYMNTIDVGAMSRVATAVRGVLSNDAVADDVAKCLARLDRRQAWLFMKALVSSSSASASPPEEFRSHRDFLRFYIKLCCHSYSYSPTPEANAAPAVLAALAMHRTHETPETHEVRPERDQQLSATAFFSGKCSPLRVSPMPFSLPIPSGRESGLPMLAVKFGRDLFALALRSGERATGVGCLFRALVRHLLWVVLSCALPTKDVTDGDVLVVRHDIARELQRGYDEVFLEYVVGRMRRHTDAASTTAAAFSNEARFEAMGPTHSCVQHATCVLREGFRITQGVPLRLRVEGVAVTEILDRIQSDRYRSPPSGLPLRSKAD